MQYLLFQIQLSIRTSLCQCCGLVDHTGFSLWKLGFCGSASKWTENSPVNDKDHKGFWVSCGWLQHPCWYSCECGPCCHSTYLFDIAVMPWGMGTVQGSLQSPWPPTSAQSLQSAPTPPLLMKCYQPENSFIEQDGSQHVWTWRPVLSSLSSLLGSGPSAGSGDPSLVSLDNGVEFVSFCK